MPSAAQYAALVAAGICPRCQKRGAWRDTKMCLVCPSKQMAAYKAWAARNRDKVRGYKRKHRQKLKERKDRCLGCTRPIKKFRRCFRCRRYQAIYMQKHRRQKKRNISP